MLSVGVTELKTDLKKILARIKRGGAVVITQRGKPVARLMPEPSGAKPSLEQRLAALAKAGLIELPSRDTRDRPNNFKPLPSMGGKPLSEIVIEDRR